MNSGESFPCEYAALQYSYAHREIDISIVADPCEDARHVCLDDIRVNVRWFNLCAGAFRL